jgi:hypothetical protein
MAIEAHKCNVEGCKGFVTFENADFDLQDIPIDDKYRCYSFGRPTCSECGKEFLIIPYYIVIDVEDGHGYEYEQLDSACMTEVEKRQRELGLRR